MDSTVAALPDTVAAAETPGLQKRTSGQQRALDFAAQVAGAVLLPGRTVVSAQL